MKQKKTRSDSNPVPKVRKRTGSKYSVTVDFHSYNPSELRGLSIAMQKLRTLPITDQMTIVHISTTSFIYMKNQIRLYAEAAEFYKNMSSGFFDIYNNLLSYSYKRKEEKYKEKLQNYFFNITNYAK